MNCPLRVIPSPLPFVPPEYVYLEGLAPVRDAIRSKNPTPEPLVSRASHAPHQLLSLAQRQLVNHAQCHAYRDCQIQVFRLATPGLWTCHRPLPQRVISDPCGQITPPSEACIVFGSIRYSIPPLRKFVSARGVKLIRYQGDPEW